VGGTWVSETLEFRRNWDAGKYRDEERRYIERFAKIDAPVEEVMRRFR